MRSKTSRGAAKTTRGRVAPARRSAARGAKAAGAKAAGASAPATGAGRSPGTSHEVAELAGVSRSAVSRTFTPNASVSARTRRKVLEAATQLGYQPNIIARSLITRRSRMIGLVMGEWENPFYTTMLRGFSEKLQLRGYQVMLLTRGADGSVDAAVRLLLQYRVDGMVLVSCAPSAEVAAECARAGVPVVLVNREAAGMPATAIVSDNARVGREVAELLLRAGYQRLAIVRGDATIQTGIARTQSFKAAVRSARKAQVVIDQANVMGYAAGRRFVHDALRHESPPDAIFCSSDQTAIGVLDGARIDLGAKVPESLAVVGFGDTPAAAWASNDLTTVRLPVERMIDASIQAVLSGAEPDPRRAIVIEADIVQRSTVRFVRAAQ